MAQVIYRRPPKLSKFLIFEKMPKSYVIDNRRKEMSTKLWYSTISHLATLGLSAFFGVLLACAHALTIFTPVSKRDAVN